MLEKILLVISGGVVASIMPIMTIINQNKKWKKEQSISNLKERRSELKTACDKASEQLYIAIKNKRIPFDMAADFTIVFPEEVSKKFHKMLSDKKADDKTIRLHCYDIIKTMKQGILNIDKTIEEEIKQ